MALPSAETNRIFWIDVLRGLAIILMIPANMAPYLAEPHPMLYRFFGSFAAPIFIMLSAGMVALRAEKHSFGYYLKRGFYVVLFGVLLDVLLWKILPFTSFDVLYTIGAGMVVVYAFRKVPVPGLLGIALVIFVAAFAALKIFGYNETVLEVYYLEEFYIPDFGRLLQSWFIDGWFPILPWIGFAILGAAFFTFSFNRRITTPSYEFLTSGLVFTLLGLLLFYIPIEGYPNFASGDIIDIRGGYSEIFYPASPAYIVCAIGVFLFLVWAVARLRKNPLTEIVAFFGKYSMLVYLTHQIIGAVLIEPFIGAFGVETITIGWFFTLANIIVVIIVFFICYIIDTLKKDFTVRSVFLQILIGK